MSGDPLASTQVAELDDSEQRLRNSLELVGKVTSGSGKESSINDVTHFVHLFLLILISTYTSVTSLTTLSSRRSLRDDSLDMAHYSGERTLN